MTSEMSTRSTAAAATAAVAAAADVAAAAPAAVPEGDFDADCDDDAVIVVVAAAADVVVVAIVAAFTASNAGADVCVMVCWLALIAVSSSSIDAGSPQLWCIARGWNKQPSVL